MSSKKKNPKPHVHRPSGGGNDGNKRTKNISVKTGYLKYLIAILLLTAVVYFPSLKNGFTNFDDEIYVTENTLVTGSSPTKTNDIIKTQVAGNYHPITIFSLAFNYNISGLNSYSYHALSLVFHLLNTLLVFFFVRLLFRDRPEIALITALFFGIHPMHVESVAWVSARKDVLYVFFFLLGLLTYIKYLDTKKVLYYLLTLALMLLSCASKPAAVVFPLILFAIDFFQKRNFHWKVIIEKIPFLALSVFFGLITLKAQEASAAIGQFVDFGIFHRIMLASYGLLMYLVKMIVPIGLSAMHPFPDFTKGIPPVFFVSLVFVLGLAFLTFISLRKTRVFAFGFIFYLISLVLVLQFMAVGQAVIAERYTYLAYIGPFMAMGYAFSLIVQDKSGKFSRFKLPAQAALVLYGGLMTYTSFERTKVWKNSETLWSDVIKKYPDDYFAYLGRANWYFENNEIQKSFEDYSKITVLEPGKAEGFVGQGKVFRKNNQTLEALEAYNKALAIDSFDSYAYNNRGNIYFDRGENDLALADYKKALTIVPGSSNTFNNIGSIYVRKNDYPAALENYDKSLELNPLNADTYLNRCMVYIMTKKSGEAQKSFEQYFKLIQDKATKEAFYWNGVNHQNQKHYAEAIASFTNAIRLSPNSGSYYKSRSEAYLAIGDKQNATSDELKAKELSTVK